MKRPASNKDRQTSQKQTPAAEPKKSGRGGRRPGAGRKPKWGGKTVVMRVPESMVEEIQAFIQAKVDLAAAERRGDDELAAAARRDDATILTDAIAAGPVDAPIQPVSATDRADELFFASTSAAPAPQEPETTTVPRQSPRQKGKSSRAKSKNTIGENQLTLFDLGF